MRKLSGLLLFGVGLAALLGLLKAANWAPGLIGDGMMREYPSVDEARRTLKLSYFPMPSYVPQDLRWPPSTVLAQRKPFEAILVEFSASAGEETALVISKSASWDFDPGWKIRMEKTREKAEYDLRGRIATLEAGDCEDGSPCSAVWWDEGGYRIKVLMRSPPFDAIRVAESMVE